MPDAAKTCAYCGADCTNKPRTKDEAGRYYCKECFPLAAAAAKAKGTGGTAPQRAAPGPKAANSAIDPFDDPIILAPDLVVPRDEPTPAAKAQTAQTELPPKSCPSCGVILPGAAVLCTNCGFNTATQKGLKTKIERAKAAKASGHKVAAMGDYANSLQRFIAALIDGVILAIITTVAMVGVSALGQLDPDAWTAALEAGEIPADFALVLLVYFGVQWVYFALQESSNRQASVGKSVMGFSNATAGGENVGFLRASARFWIKTIGLALPAVGFFYAIACLICCIITPRKQMPHDLITGVVMMR